MVLRSLGEACQGRAGEVLPGKMLEGAEGRHPERRAAAHPHRDRHIRRDRDGKPRGRPPVEVLREEHQAAERIPGPGLHAVLVEPASEEAATP